MIGARPLAVIGAPSSAGAYGPGQEKAPEAFRRHGLVSQLAAAGLAMDDRGDGRRVMWAADPGHPEAGNVPEVTAVARELADSVATAFSDGHDVLVLGGDCTIELGTVAGARRDGAHVGVAYVDLDADLNTPATGDGILDWMGVAHLLALPGTVEELTGLAGERPLLVPGDLRLIATENITDPERRVIDELGLVREPLAAVTGDLAAVLARTAEWARDLDRLLVHVDVDVLDFERFAIAEHDDPRGGLSLGELEAVLEGLCALPEFAALTICEVNPDHAPDEEAAFADLIAMLARVLKRD